MKFQHQVYKFNRKINLIQLQDLENCARTFGRGTVHRETVRRKKMLVLVRLG